MRRITAGSPPAAFVFDRARGVAYGDLFSMKALRRQLWEQQGGRCAYCERRLKGWDRDDHDTKVEHFHPQHTVVWTSDCKTSSGATKHDKSATSWPNLLLCCDGATPETEGRTIQHCDSRKGDIDVCSDFRSPRAWTGDRLVDVKRSGRLQVVGGLPDRAQEVIDDVLNLNCTIFVEARKATIDALLRRLAPSFEQSISQRAKVAEALRAQADNVEYATAYLTLADKFAGA